MEDCKYKPETDAAVKFDIKDYAMINGYGYETEAKEIVARLQGGPVSVAFHADCDAVWYYKTGVLRQTDCVYSDADHVATLVGFIPKGEPFVNKYTTYEKRYRFRYSYDPAGGCYWKDEEFVASKNLCMWEEEVEHTEEMDGEAMWIAQNTWGKDWGKAGYFHVAVEDGKGFNGWN